MFDLLEMLLCVDIGREREAAGSISVFRMSLCAAEHVMKRVITLRLYLSTGICSLCSKRRFFDFYFMSVLLFRYSLKLRNKQTTVIWMFWLVPCYN